MFSGAILLLVQTAVRNCRSLVEKRSALKEPCNTFFSKQHTGMGVMPYESVCVEPLEEELIMEMKQCPSAISRECDVRWGVHRVSQKYAWKGERCVLEHCSLPAQCRETSHEVNAGISLTGPDKLNYGQECWVCTFSSCSVLNILAIY